MYKHVQVWQHFDDGCCPGESIGVRVRLENGLSGFIHTRNLSDKHVSAPEERVDTCELVELTKLLKRIKYYIVCVCVCRLV